MDQKKIILALIVVIIALIVVGMLLFNPIHAKQNTSIQIKSSTTLHAGDEVKIQLTNESNVPIGSQAVNITVIGSDFENHRQVVTNDSGEASWALDENLTAGTYTVQVTYGGNENYTESNVTGTVEIGEAVQETQESSAGSTYEYMGLTVDSQTGIVVSPGQYHGWYIEDVKNQPHDMI